VTRPQQQRMLRVVLPGKEATFEQIESLLSETGIQLDRTYGPFQLNSAYVVRGTADPEAFERAKKIPGVEIFGDPSIKPTSLG
jgi:hypothetical protein